MKEACPENPNMNTALEEEKDPKKKWGLDTSRIGALGMEFIPAATALKTQIASIIATFPESENGIEAAPPPAPEPEPAVEEAKDDEAAENPLQADANPTVEPVAEPAVAAAAEPVAAAGPSAI